MNMLQNNISMNLIGLLHVSVLMDYLMLMIDSITREVDCNTQ